MSAVVPFVTALSTLVALAALVWVHIAPTGLSPWSDPVSQYALTRFRAGYRTAAFAAAVAGAGTAVELSGLPVGAVPSVVLLTVFALARAVIPFVPMDAPHDARSAVGRAHNMLAVIAFATVTAAAFLAVAPLRESALGTLAALTTVAAIVMAVGSAGVVVSGVIRPMRRVFGAVERLIYLGFVAWFLCLAIGFIALTG